MIKYYKLYPLFYYYLIFVSVPYFLGYVFDVFNWIAFVVSFFLGTYFDILINNSFFRENSSVSYLFSVMIFSLIYYVIHILITFYNLKNKVRYRIYLLVIISNFIWNIVTWGNFVI